MDKPRETLRRSIERRSVAPGVSRKVKAPLYEQLRREWRRLRCHRTGLEMGRGPLDPVEAMLLFPMPCSLVLRCKSVVKFQLGGKGGVLSLRVIRKWKMI